MPRPVRFVAALAPALLLLGCGGGNSMPGVDGGNGGGCQRGQEKFGEVCLTPPTIPASRTPCGDVTEFCDKVGTTRPRLDCLGAARMPPATPDKVTLTGFVHPFSGGKSNSPVTIQIFRAADLLAGMDPATAPQVVPPTMITFDPKRATDASQFRVCDTDPRVGCISVTPDACKAPVCNDGLGGRADEGAYCVSPGGKPSCVLFDPVTKHGRLRFEPRFSIPNLPTNTSLVIRSSGADGLADNQWAVLLAWNVVLATDERACADPLQSDCLDLSDKAKPRYQLNISVLSQSDYYLIPNAAGLSGGLSPGQSAVAGEVRDCDGVRIGSAQVGVLPAGDRFTYFNGNPYMTVPEASRASTGTDRLGLYSALNVAPGKVRVEAAGLLDGKSISLGKLAAVAYPNSIAVLNINGGKPQQ